MLFPLLCLSYVSVYAQIKQMRCNVLICGLYLIQMSHLRHLCSTIISIFFYFKAKKRHLLQQTVKEMFCLCEFNKVSHHYFVSINKNCSSHEKGWYSHLLFFIFIFIFYFCCVYPPVISSNAILLTLWL